MTIEAVRPDSVPEADLSTVGPITVTRNVPGFPTARRNGPGWVEPETDYALPNTYVEPFMFPMAARQPNYPLDLVGPGNFKRQGRGVDIRQYIHHDDEYGGGGGLYVGDNEYGDDYNDGLGADLVSAGASLVSSPSSAEVYGPTMPTSTPTAYGPSVPTLSAAGQTAAGGGPDIVGALSSIVTAAAAGGQQLFSVYQQGRAAIKDAKAMNEPGPRIPGTYQRPVASSDGGNLKLAVLAGVGVLAVLLLVGNKKKK